MQTPLQTTMGRQIGIVKSPRRTNKQTDSAITPRLYPRRSHIHLLVLVNQPTEVEYVIYQLELQSEANLLAPSTDK